MNEKNNIDLIKKTPSQYNLMIEELDGVKDFSKRLEIITDTIENVFRLQNGQKALTYKEYALKRRKIFKKSRKRIKNTKSKWK